MNIRIHHRRLPSTALVITLLTGLSSICFGLIGPTGGRIEAILFGLSLLVIVWLLWIRPRLGAMVLIMVGAGFGTWMLCGWPIGGWTIPAALVTLPIILGAFTFARETVGSRMLTCRW